MLECKCFNTLTKSEAVASLFEGVTDGGMQAFMSKPDAVRVAEFIHRVMQEQEVGKQTRPQKMGSRSQ